MLLGNGSLETSDIANYKTLIITGQPERKGGEVHARMEWHHLFLVNSPGSLCGRTGDVCTDKIMSQEGNETLLQ